MILLDTYTLIWLSGDNSKLSLCAADFLKNSESLFVSSVTAFEISFKLKKRKLELPFFSKTWFQDTLDYYRIEEIPVNAEIYSSSVELPPLHEDPADRILIATALRRNLIILTPDSHIQKYPGLRCAW